MNKIKVLFFATLRDSAGAKSVEIEISSNATVRDLKENIARRFPGLGPSLKTVITSINHEYAAEDAVLPANAEVGMFPPVSGG